MIVERKRSPRGMHSGRTGQIRTMRERIQSAGARFLALVALGCALTGCGQPPDVVTGVVERVIDGDTIVVRGVGTVRYIGIDTPELHHPRRPIQRLARAAWQRNLALVGRQRVEVHFGVERHDSHGRVLADVYRNGRFVNAELVAAGLARTLTISPNVRHARQLRALEQTARHAQRGLWGSGEGGPPWGTP